MAPRRLEAQLTLAALGLLAGQLLLLAALWTRPEAPDELPAVETAPRKKPLTDAVAPANTDAATVELLDRLLAERVAAAAARKSMAPAAYAPRPELRAAALAHPDPEGPEVQALVEAYGEALKALGETLDAATSTPSPAASPGTPVPPPASPPPAPPASGSPATSAGPP